MNDGPSVINGEDCKDQRISFADPKVQRCPFPIYAALRDEEPIYRDPVNGHFVLTRHADVRKVVLNTRAYSNRTGIGPVRRDDDVSQEAIELDAIYQDRGWLPLDTLVSNDPPTHKRYRSLVDKVFAPSRITSLEPRIREIAIELADALNPSDELDFAVAFAQILPMKVIFEQLGMAGEDISQFRHWSELLLSTKDPSLTHQGKIDVAMGVTDMQQHMAGLIDSLRETPDDRLLSYLVHTQADGEPLDMREMMGVIQQLFVAGNDTSAGALTSGMKLLVETPGLADALHAEPSRIAAFVEEILRLYSPIQTMFRLVREDVEISGVQIPKGSIVEVRFGAANRDPSTFPCPDALNIDREKVSTHMAFGAGIHTCIGNQLARAQIRIAFEELISRFRDFRYSRGEASCRNNPLYISYGYKTMWIAMDRREAATI